MLLQLLLSPLAAALAAVTAAAPAAACAAPLVTDAGPSDAACVPLLRLLQLGQQPAARGLGQFRSWVGLGLGFGHGLSCS